MHHSSRMFCCTSFKFVMPCWNLRVTSTRGQHTVTFFLRTSRVNARFVTMVQIKIPFHSTFSERSHFLASHSGPSWSFQKRLQRNDVRRKVVFQNDSSFSVAIQFIYEAKPVNYHAWAKPGNNQRHQTVNY